MIVPQTAAPLSLWSLADPAPALLLALRRLACAGLGDPMAHALVAEQFGAGHVRVLVLAQLFLARLAAGAARPLKLAPPCALRACADEAALMAAVARAAAGDAAGAVALLARLVNEEALGGVLEAAAALGEAARDCGRPLAAGEGARPTLH